jgi:hypothetical protein
MARALPRVLVLPNGHRNFEKCLSLGRENSTIYSILWLYKDNANAGVFRSLASDFALADPTVLKAMLQYSIG